MYAFEPPVTWRHGVIMIDSYLLSSHCSFASHLLDRQKFIPSYYYCSYDRFIDLFVPSWTYRFTHTYYNLLYWIWVVITKTLFALYTNSSKWFVLYLHISSFPLVCICFVCWFRRNHNYHRHNPNIFSHIRPNRYTGALLLSHLIKSLHRCFL